MGDLTEAEIFDCLATNARLAAEHCGDLARLPAKGPTYLKFRAELKLVEGACKQASVWRQDTRFLDIGLKMAHAHRVAGEWLRGIKIPGTMGRRKLRENELHPNFVRLGEVLQMLYLKAEDVRTKKTGRIGMILPDEAPPPHRDTRPVGWTSTRGGILIPEGTSVRSAA